MARTSGRASTHTGVPNTQQCGSTSDPQEDKVRRTELACLNEVDTSSLQLFSHQS